mgnify:CR=1 FL=1
MTEQEKRQVELAAKQNETVEKTPESPKKQGKIGRSWLLLGILVVFFLFAAAVPKLAGESGGQETALPVAQVEPELGVEEDLLLESTAKVEITPETPEKSAGQTEKDFYANYRLERSKIRGQQMEMLQEIIDDEKSSNEMRQTAQEKVVAISEALEQELLLENVLAAKYGGQAAVFVQEEKATVVLDLEADALPTGGAEQIARLVAGYTSVPFEHVVIVLDAF